MKGMHKACCHFIKKYSSFRNWPNSKELSHYLASHSIQILVSIQVNIRHSCYYAVFFQVAQTPIKLLTVPARPTMPSSRFVYASAVLGIVRSQRSEMSCRLVEARSLRKMIRYILITLYVVNNSPLNLLPLNSTLSIILVDVLLLFPKMPQGIETCKGIKC